MLRLRSNCRVTLVLPRELDEVISVMPAIWPNCRSKGVATEDAMICALAPGRLAETEIVGKSTWGRGETGSTLKAIPPAIAIAAVSRVVATGRRMKGAERVMRDLAAPVRGLRRGAVSRRIVAPGCQRRCRSPAWCTG